MCKTIHLHNANFSEKETNTDLLVIWYCFGIFFENLTICIINCKLERLLCLKVDDCKISLTFGWTHFYWLIICGFFWLTQFEENDFFIAKLSMLLSLESFIREELLCTEITLLDHTITISSFFNNICIWHNGHYCHTIVPYYQSLKGDDGDSGVCIN